MKPIQKQFIYNIIECARQVYVKVFNLAINGDFVKNKKALDKLDSDVFNIYYSCQKRPKKVFKTLVYAGSAIYNNEMIINSDVCYDLNILLAIHQLRLYKPHKFIQFVDSNKHIQYIVPGMKYNRLNDLVNNILKGVR